MKVVKQALKEKGIDYEETKFPEYLITGKNPISFIPPGMAGSVVVKESNESYFSILKQAGTLAYLFTPEKIEPGDIVRIKKGPLQGLTGIVKEVRKRTYAVEMGAWGRIVKESFSIGDIEKVEEELAK